MPRELNFMNEKLMVGGNYEISWPRKTGREIYNSRTISGLNKIPIIIHSSYILGNARVDDEDEPPLDLQQLTESLIIDGTIVILKPDVNEEDKEPEFLTDIITALPDLVVQKQPANEDGYPVMRVWKKEGEKWAWIDYIHYGTVGEASIDDGEIKGDRLYIFINGIGVLAPAYDTLYRLEEIRLRIRTFSNRAVMMVVSGFTGDMKQTEDAVKDEDATTLFIPRAAAVDFMGTTAAVDQFLRDSDALLPLYWKLTRLIEVGDSLNVSGVARRLIMQPMLYYIQSNMKKVKKIYSDWGYEITFDTIPILSIDERRAEFELLKSMRDSGSIDQEDFDRRVEKLI